MKLLLHRLLLAALSIHMMAVHASSLQFANIMVYGYDRSDTTGIHDGSDKMTVTSPSRGSLKAGRKETAWAKAWFTSRNRLVASADNGGLVGLVRGNDLLYPDWMKNSRNLLFTERIKKHEVGKAKPGDLVFVFVPHTSRLDVKERDFYKAFDGQSQLDQRALLARYVRNFTDKKRDNEGDRFTLVIAEVRAYDREEARKSLPMAAIEISKDYAHNREGTVSPIVSPGRRQEAPVFVAGAGAAPSGIVYGAQPSFVAPPSSSYPPPQMQPVFVQQPQPQQTPSFSGCPHMAGRQSTSQQQNPSFGSCPHMAASRQANPQQTVVIQQQGPAPTLVANPLNANANPSPGFQQGGVQFQRQPTDQERLIPQAFPPGHPQFGKDPFISGSGRK
jgi:hypothetical protein